MSIQTLEATPFIGRGRELTEATQALASASLLTLVGSGGTGKTRLALRLLTELRAGGFPGNSWFVDLSDVRDPALLEMTVAEGIGLRPRGGEDQFNLIVEFLGDRPALLVLDNCEQILATVGDLVAHLVLRCPGLQVLATSRGRLGVRGEIVYRVPPLALPSATEDFAVIAASEAVQLFVDRARRALPEFRLTPENADAIARLCIALDGLPLALELAAAQIPALSPGAILERLQNRFVELHITQSNTPHRHHSLEACIDWSHDLCSPREQLLWARASVFAGGFELSAVEKVCSGDGLEEDEVLETLAGLIDRSIITREVYSEPPRYRMLSQISAYGALRLSRTQGGSAPWRLRHGLCFADRASAIGAGWVGPDQPALVRELELNHANMNRALEALLELQDSPDAAVRAAIDLEGYWLLSGQLGEARHWLTLGLASGVNDAALRVRALCVGSFLASALAEAKTARLEVETAAQILDTLPEELRNDPYLRCELLLAQATQHLFAGDAETCAKVCAEMAPLAHELEVGTLRLLCSIATSLAYSAAGRFEESTAEVEAAVVLCDGVGEFQFKSFLLWISGLTCLQRGEVEVAEARARAALALKLPLHDRLGSALIFELLAAAATAQDEALRAGTLLGAAENQWRRVQLSALSAPYIAAQREIGERVARDAIPDRAFNAAYRKGQQMSLEAAHEFALRQSGADQRGLEGLTSREREVAHLISRGMTNQQIADTLVISLRTAQGHVENILRKLGLTSRTQVAALVLTEGHG